MFLLKVMKTLQIATGFFILGSHKFNSTVAPEINYYDLVYCTVVDRSS